MRSAGVGAGYPAGRRSGDGPDRAVGRRVDRGGAGHLPAGSPGTAIHNTFPSLFAR